MKCIHTENQVEALCLKWHAFRGGTDKLGSGGSRMGSLEHPARGVNANQLNRQIAQNVEPMSSATTNFEQSGCGGTSGEQPQPGLNAGKGLVAISLVELIREFVIADQHVSDDPRYSSLNPWLLLCVSRA
jgi:hypothetical protein